jgi:mannose-1-phosphate guanylyltransferase / mannose-6-phosphate isomerase
MNEDLIIPVIVCGGSGTRLWPSSRDSFPKPFLALSDSHSSFQKTLLRVSNVEGFAPPLIIANEAHRFLVAEQIRALAVQATIIIEPERRDTAAAIAAAAEIVVRRTPEAVMAILAADHVIKETRKFTADCHIAARAARRGRIVAFGIVPSEPSASYGYIRPGDAVEGIAQTYAVTEFCEKPDCRTAERLIAEGCLWNSGNFVATAAVMHEELMHHAPDIAGPVAEAVDGLVKDMDFQRLPKEVFGAAARNSIDRAVMEKTRRAAVVRANFDWSDIGTWNALWNLGERDNAGNVTVGDVVVLESTGCYVRCEGPLVAVAGLRDLVVVSTEDATLVVPRERADIVKSLVDHLAKAGHSAAAAHRRVYRPWGHYQCVALGDRFQVKHIVVKPKARLSLQKHFHRAEHWIVVSGTGRVTIDENESLVHENESIQIRLGSRHRLENPGSSPLELIEVQYGTYLGEDDIVRLEDAYGRV